MLSVCMATYNGAQFVVRQLDSVLKQLHPEDEVIVVDDGSKDSTVQVIRETFGDRVQVYVNKENLGVIHSFERAISLAKGDILFLCDQDDIWEDHKVECVMQEFEQRHADLVVHDAFVVDGNLDTIDPSWNHFNHNNLSQDIIGNVLKNAYTGAFMAFKRELAHDFLPFPPSIEMHDQWIALVCMMKKKRIAIIDKPLMNYVRHGGNVTGMKKRSLTAKLKGRMGTLTAIIQYKNRKL